jgi:hypothetical protein
VLAPVRVDHLGEGFEGKLVHPVGGFRKGEEASLRALEDMPVDVGRDGKPPVGPIAEKSLKSRFGEEAEQLYPCVRDRPEGMGFPGPRGTFEEDVNSWENRVE